MSEETVIHKDVGARLSLAEWEGADTHLGIKFIRKAADETVNNSDVLQDDDELKWDVAANEVWAFTGYFRKLSTIATVKYQWSIPVNATLFSKRTNTAPGAEIAHNVSDTVSADAVLQVSHYFGIYIGGDTGGTVNLRWAQNVASVSDTTVKANSWIVAVRLA